ncbi:hypothetical protein [Pseudomonas sp. H3(2019)]|uniref:hypothetical protein n=1 Tax=Pseudomonas sp. H3(2019) TaxID=2598724 RepID=UPI0011908931|nr:hypothetical protein [Pseudomonas sp. H3(2019)]TVT84841.1 hypothetical protein FPT12_07165 [Pseudomonas sp. H3(2019)]
MNAKNTNYNHSNNSETSTDSESVATAKVVNETSTLSRRKRPLDGESSADRKRGTGGLDSLGQGNLP